MSHRERVLATGCVRRAVAGFSATVASAVLLDRRPSIGSCGSAMRSSSILASTATAIVAAWSTIPARRFSPTRVGVMLARDMSTIRKCAIRDRCEVDRAVRDGSRVAKAARETHLLGDRPFLHEAPHQRDGALAG